MADAIGTTKTDAITRSGRLVFHMVGDTGGVKDPVPQTIVASKLEAQLQGDAASQTPTFFYHLGDVVYFNGEAGQYFSQFYHPYEFYDAPILAIPGNHDGFALDETREPSLAAFMRNFCSPSPVITPDNQDTVRHAMTQPNCYFTLEAPFLTLIGLYSNVPEGGEIHKDQIDWFVDELKAAPTDKALIVAVHHPVFSFDAFHSGSEKMRQILDDAFAASGRHADAVFTGHVHNYQRFTRRVAGRDVPYIVAGAGGYHNLHRMQKASDGGSLQVPLVVPEEHLTLEDYFDDRFGFLKVMVDAQNLSAEYYTVPRPQEAWSHPEDRYDSFTLDWKNGRLVPRHP
ncbi:metallophosphoesterase family protein [Paludisphaera rhizosphaerae]|uniref:metallophosphoesterase family protein n=1 Tax=Paludisphaera rhizosphaerae TaxID=2711216 RepID=UPI0013ECA1DA|nr:metallophosphoesterase [Paludisphaera rhizosphaerae]